jgi:hypothetical protein
MVSLKKDETGYSGVKVVGQMFREPVLMPTQDAFVLLEAPLSLFGPVFQL